MARVYSIGEMARSGNCKVQTVRYYEQIGLLPTPARNAGNQRTYTDEHFDRATRPIGLPQGSQTLKNVGFVETGNDHDEAQIAAGLHAHLRWDELMFEQVLISVTVAFAGRIRTGTRRRRRGHSAKA